MISEIFETAVDSLQILLRPFMPAVASQCQSLPVSAGHSHSIVNEPFFLFMINDLMVGACGNTTNNTMLRNYCRL
jgi:hypothetical protein